MPVTNVKVPVTTIFRNAREFFNLPVKISEKMAVKFLALLVKIFDKMPVESQKVPVTKFRNFYVSRAVWGVTGKKKHWGFTSVKSLNCISKSSAENIIIAFHKKRARVYSQL